MRPEYNRKTDFSRDELIDVLDSFLKYQAVFDERFSGVDISSLKFDSSKYHTDGSSHEFIDYDYTYVRVAWRLVDVLFDYHILDRENLPNFRKICEKYDVGDVKEASMMKLDFLEIITILTYIYRADHHADGGWFELCVEDGTFYSLLSRLEEIRAEL